MPLSFSNISSTVILVMLGCLVIAELVKYLRRHPHQ